MYQPTLQLDCTSDKLRSMQIRTQTWSLVAQAPKIGKRTHERDCGDTGSAAIAVDAAFFRSVSRRVPEFPSVSRSVPL